MTFRVWSLLLATCVADTGLYSQDKLDQAGKLSRIAYNHPGLKVDLQVGLWSYPMPMDATGDGVMDLAVGCVDEAYTGVYVFENLGGDPVSPTFRLGRKLSFGRSNLAVSYVGGQPRVMRPAAEFPDFLNTGLEKPKGLRLPGNPHSVDVRRNIWSYADYDGDGATDILVGSEDWTDYGWRNAYDANGRWVNGPLRGFVYLLRNGGTDEKPAYEKPVKVMTDDRPVEVYGQPSPQFADFRGTGKLDLICGEMLDGFTFFENTGTRTEPKYARGKRLRTADGRPLTMNLEMITPVALDWDRDGHVDLVCGEEDGRVALIRNTGTISADGVPVFDAPRYFQQEAGDVDLGALATPVGVDWDGDGSEDIVSGNTAGEIIFLKNLSAPGVEQPEWAAPVRLEAEGKPVRIMAGPNGSLQGPAEAKWGYTALSVADWDADGLPDIVVNSIWGKVVWYRNCGTRTAPRLEKSRPVEVEWEGPQPEMPWGWLKPEGKALLTQWRTTPVAVDWTGDGLTDLVMVDQEGVVVLYERARERSGRLVLKHPQKVFVSEKGEPLRLNAPYPKGYIGCKKLCVTDWDGDGLLDILVSNNPVFWIRQVAKHDGRHIFRWESKLGEHGLGSHDPAPGVVDWNNDKIPDLVIGPEGGHIYYMRNPRSR